MLNLRREKSMPLSKWMLSVVSGVLLLLLLQLGVSAQQKVLQVYFAERAPAYIQMHEEVLIPLFEELNPDIKIEMQIGNWSVDTISVRYIGGSPPDVIQLGSKIGGYVEMLLPLNRFTDNWDGLSDFAPAIIDGVTVNGEILAIPFAISARTLTYRKDHFSEVGLDPERPPATWDELVDYGRQLVRWDADGNMTRQAIKTGSHQMEFAQFLFQAGGNYMSEDLQRVTFADAPGIEALEFMLKLFHEYRIVDALDQAGDLRSGGASMEYVSPSAFADPNWSPAIDQDDVGVALPLSHARQTQIIMPNSWAIINTSDMAEEAWRWIEFSSSVETILDLAAAAGYVPPRLSVGTYSPWSDDPRWGTTFTAISMASTNPLKSPYFERLRTDYVEPSLNLMFYPSESVSGGVGDPRAYWLEQQEAAQAWLDSELNR